MAPFLTCQKKVVLQVKRKNKRSWRGFEAERVSGSDRSIQFQLTEKIVKYWGKKKTCVSVFPFFIFKVLLRIQQKYNIISQEFALFYTIYVFCLLWSSIRQQSRHSLLCARWNPLLQRILCSKALYDIKRVVGSDHVLQF